MRKWFSFSKQQGGPNKAELALTEAVRRIFDGNGTKADAEMLLVHLVDKAGYFRRPNLSDWMTKTGSPAGFELHSALCNARAEVVQTIIDFLTLDDEQMVELQRAALVEGRL